MLRGVWTIVYESNGALTPDDVLGWKESKFYAWLEVARDEADARRRSEAFVRYAAYHDPKHLSKALSVRERRIRRRSEPTTNEILRKVEMIRRMAGSGSVHDPNQAGDD